MIELIKGDGQKTLIQAIKANDILKVKALIAAKVNLSEFDENGFFPLVYACSYDRLEITKLLIKGGCSLNKATQDSSETPLMFAVRFGCTEIVEFLLDNGAFLHHQNIRN